PFYLEALALWIRGFEIFESSETLDGGKVLASIRYLRSFGTLTGLLTALLLGWGIFRANRTDQREKTPNAWFAASIGISVLLLHPYFIQSSLLVDIDNTLLIP